MREREREREIQKERERERRDTTKRVHIFFVVLAILHIYIQ